MTKLTIPVSSLRITSAAMATPFLEHFALRNPEMAGFIQNDANVRLFNPDDYTHDNAAWEEIRWLQHKPIFVVSSDDRLPPMFVWDAVNTHLGSVIEFTHQAHPLKTEGLLMNRRLVYTGQKGHDHMRVEPAGTGKYDNMAFEGITFVPGTEATHPTEDAIKAQFSTY